MKKITADTIRKILHYDALLAKGWPEAALPTTQTISNILDRHNYRLRVVAKAKVQKKPETDAIFEIDLTPFDPYIRP